MGEFQDDLGVPCVILALGAATDDEETRGRMRAAFIHGRVAVSANLEIVRSFIAAWRRNELDEILSFFSDDCVYHNMPIEPARGIEATRAMIQGFSSMAREVEWILHQIAETPAGVVLTERTDRFEIGGRWVELPVMGSFELREGKITAWRDYFDLAQFQRQLPGAARSERSEPR
jgi:limonene-1,2-epoxide hydrolase